MCLQAEAIPAVDLCLPAAVLQSAALRAALAEDLETALAEWEVTAAITELAALVTTAKYLPVLSRSTYTQSYCRDDGMPILSVRHLPHRERFQSLIK